MSAIVLSGSSAVSLRAGLAVVVSIFGSCYAVYRRGSEGASTMISYSGVGRGSVFAPFSSPPAPTSSFAGSMRRISSWIDGAGGRVPIAAANLSKTSVVMDVGVGRVVTKRENEPTPDMPSRALPPSAISRSAAQLSQSQFCERPGVRYSQGPSYLSRSTNDLHQRHSDSLRLSGGIDVGARGHRTLQDEVSQFVTVRQTRQELLERKVNYIAAMDLKAGERPYENSAQARAYQFSRLERFPRAYSPTSDFLGPGSYMMRKPSDCMVY